VSVYKLRTKLSVIPRLDRGIQCFQRLLDCPVKPDNDKYGLYGQTLNKSYFLLLNCQESSYTFRQTK
jgi:hypothetical protein